MNKQRQPTDTLASMERTHAYTHQQETEHERRKSDQAAHGHRKGSDMKLVPPGPPGRITRKARDFEADIAQLRAQGYTLDAIRRALDAAGVQVSISTVRREALRSSAAVRVPPAEGAGRQTLASPESTHDRSTTALDTASPGASVPADWRSGKDVAQAYTSSVITNQFVRAKEKR